MSFFKKTKFFSSKSQSSLEFLMIFGIGLAIIAIFGGIFFNYSTEAKSSLDENQLRKTGDELISNIEKIYFLGNNNMITFTTKLPDGIENFTIVHVNNTLEFDYLNISYFADKQISSNIFTTNENYIRINCSKCYHTPNINGNYISYYNTSDFSGGVKKIKILSKSNYVQIDFINE